MNMIFCKDIDGSSLENSLSQKESKALQEAMSLPVSEEGGVGLEVEIIALHQASQSMKPIEKAKEFVKILSKYLLKFPTDSEKLRKIMFAINCAQGLFSPGDLLEILKEIKKQYSDIKGLTQVIFPFFTKTVQSKQIVRCFPKENLEHFLQEQCYTKMTFEHEGEKKKWYFLEWDFYKEIIDAAVISLSPEMVRYQPGLFQLQNSERSVKETIEERKSLESATERNFIIFNEKGEFVGFCGCFPTAINEFSISYGLSKEFQGKNLSKYLIYGITWIALDCISSEEVRFQYFSVLIHYENIGSLKAFFKSIFEVLDFKSLDSLEANAEQEYDKEDVKTISIDGKEFSFIPVIRRGFPSLKFVSYLTTNNTKGNKNEDKIRAFQSFLKKSGINITKNKKPLTEEDELMILLTKDKEEESKRLS